MSTLYGREGGAPTHARRAARMPNPAPAPARCSAVFASASHAAAPHGAPPICGGTRRVQLVRRDGRDVSTLYGREGGAPHGAPPICGGKGGRNSP